MQTVIWIPIGKGSNTSTSCNDRLILEKHGCGIRKKIQYEMLAMPRSNNLLHLKLTEGGLPKLYLNLKIRFPAS